MGMPVKDTIKIVDEDRYAVSTPPRSTMWQIQTPQCFVTAEIREAYQKMMEAGDDSVTDDGMVMETYGIRGVRMIKGSYENMKITTPEDMLLGEAILKGGVRRGNDRRYKHEKGKYDKSGTGRNGICRTSCTGYF